MLGRTPVLEAGSAAAPPSGPVLDGEKSRAALLLSGVFLSIVGVTFTTMGWQRYQNNFGFHWTQLLGPILISVGGTFMLTSMCSTKEFGCWARRRQAEAGFALPAGEQGQVVVHRLDQPVVLQSAPAMLCFPPTYNFLSRVSDSRVGRSGDGGAAALPSYEALYGVSNVAFTAEEPHSSQTQQSTSRQEAGNKSGRPKEGDDSSHPPAYEDIYPSNHKNASTHF